ncbi:MAG: fibronectin type III domain-containing protein, partial [Pseudomonadota bacterium]|nr:fibronectin type III domain-containing protein [Pseudomonadota bacterium]
AAGVIFMAENSKGSAFPTGEIKPLVQMMGLKGWDPTLDSTYPGGSGPCRLHDSSTWVTLTCPILWALKWALGLWEGPTLKGAPAHGSTTDYQVGGIGAKLSGIDVPAFVAASNIAKANGWTVSAYPNTDDDKHQVLQSFLQAGGAIYSQRAGKISCISRAAPRSSIVTISAADTAGPLEIDAAASRIDRINTLRPRFWSPAHRWQMTALDGEVTAESYREEDGAVRSRGIDYPYVSNAVQAAQLAALQIANTREGIAGVIPLKPHLQRIRPGDAFTITESGFVLNGLKCLCLNTDYDPATGVVRVSFVSETDGKYPFALGQSPTPPEPQVLTPVDPRYVTPPLPGDWTITPRPPAPGGGGLPSFDLTGVVSNDTATAIIVEYGPTATGPWTQAYQGPPTVTNIPIEGLQPGATYYVAVQYQRNQNYSDRYVYGPYTAPLLDPSPNAPSLVDLEERVTDAFGEDIADVEGALDEARADIDAQGVEIAAARGDQPSLNSRIVQVNQARIDGDTSNATAISNLSSRTSTTETDIIDLETALAGEAAARAAAISRVEARAGVNDVLDSEFRGYVAGDVSWGFASNYGGASAGANFDVYWSANQNVLYSFLSGTPPTGSIGDWRSGWMTTEEGARYEGGAMLAPHNGAGQVFIEFADRHKTVFQTALLGTGGRSGGGANGDPANFDLVGGFVVAPSGAVFRRLLVRNLSLGGVGYTFMPFIRPYSRPATAIQTALSGYSEGASTQVNAAATQHSLAIIDLENQQALARWEVVANASGGKPARIGLTSSSLGSFVALDAPYIFWGDNTVFDDATDTLQTTVGPNIRVLAFGAPFGASGNLLEWWGPSSIAIGSMTTANGLNGRMTTAPYVFDNVVVTVAARFAAGTVTVFRATSSTTAAQLTSTGTVLVEASVTSTSEDDVTAPIVTADVVGVSSGGVETVLATKSMGSGLPEDPLVHTFAPVQGSYPTYRVKVRGSGPVSKDGQSTVEVTLKTSPVA